VSHLSHPPTRRSAVSGPARLGLLLAALALSGCARVAAPEPAAAQESQARGPFELCAATAHPLFIWDMHPVEAPSVVRAVCARLEASGFRRAPAGGGRFLVNIQVFAGDRRPKDLTVAVECLDPASRERLWIGTSSCSEASPDGDGAALVAELARDPRLARFLARP
jgi:hypothetical protein